MLEFFNITGTPMIVPRPHPKLLFFNKGFH